MTSFAKRIRPHVDAELRSAAVVEGQGHAALAFTHLERAHVLGQASTVQHVRVHCQMLCWGWRQRDLKECLGQVLRVVGAVTKTGMGLVPVGNTGGSNVSPLKRLPVPPELAVLIRRAQVGGR